MKLQIRVDPATGKIAEAVRLMAIPSIPSLDSIFHKETTARLLLSIFLKTPLLTYYVSEIQDVRLWKCHCEQLIHDCK